MEGGKSAQHVFIVEPNFQLYNIGEGLDPANICICEPSYAIEGQRSGMNHRGVARIWEIILQFVKVFWVPDVDTSEDVHLSVKGM